MSLGLNRAWTTTTTIQTHKSVNQWWYNMFAHTLAHIKIQKICIPEGLDG